MRCCKKLYFKYFRAEKENVIKHDVTKLQTVVTKPQAVVIKPPAKAQPKIKETTQTINSTEIVSQQFNNLHSAAPSMITARATSQEKTVSMDTVEKYGIHL